MRRNGPYGTSGSASAEVQTYVTPALSSAVLSDPGRERTLNEDAALLLDLPGGGLFAVADGMGGHAAGEVASQLALEELRAAYTFGTGSGPRRLAQAVQAANLAVYRQATGHEAGMGTTLTGALIDGSVAIIANVGDSRAYLYRAGELTRLTRDHSWVAEQVRLGFLSEQEARDHHWRNVVSNALGSEEQVRLDLLGVRLEAGDRLLICSDGLTTVLEDDEIAALLKRGTPPEELVVELIDAANDAGGPDNITVIGIDIRRPTHRPRYALPNLHPGGPVGIETLASAPRNGLLPYATLTVLYLTLFGMIVLPTLRVLIASVGAALLIALLAVTLLRRRPRARATHDETDRSSAPSQERPE